MIPNSNYIKVLKHPIDWENYSDTVCNLLGFQKKYHPLIFYSNGKYIGGKEEYFKFVKNNFYLPSLFNKDGDVSINDEIVKKLTLEHINQVNKEFLNRKQGLTIRDKIEENLEKFSSSDFGNSEINGRYNTLDIPYSTDFLGDMKIYFKLNSRFCPLEEEFVTYGDPLEENLVTLETDGDKSLVNTHPQNNTSIGNIRNEQKNTKNSLEYIDDEDEEEENTPKSILLYD